MGKSFKLKNKKEFNFGDLRRKPTMLDTEHSGRHMNPTGKSKDKLPKSKKCPKCQNIKKYCSC